MPRPGDLHLLTLKVVFEARDVAYLCANFSLPRPLCSRLRPDVCDRQTDKRQSASCLMPRLGGGGITRQYIPGK